MSIIESDSNVGIPFHFNNAISKLKTVDKIESLDGFNQRRQAKFS